MFFIENLLCLQKFQAYSLSHYKGQDKNNIRFTNKEEFMIIFFDSKGFQPIKSKYIFGNESSINDFFIELNPA